MRHSTIWLGVIVWRAEAVREGVLAGRYRNLKE